MTGGNRSRNQPQPTFDEILVDVENIGGISSATLRLSQGITVLTGENATNRTSLLRAIAGGLGGTAGTLKQNADSGSVSLTIDGESFTREYTQDRSSVQTSGSPYIRDEGLVDLFVCLLEHNPIRQAVRADGDLAELLLSPIDTDEIKAEIRELQSERRQIEARHTEIEREEKRLPQLEERRNNLHDQISKIKSELRTVREQTSDIDRETAETDETESILSSLEEAQGKLERTEAELDTQRNVREELKKNLTDVREKLSQVEVQEEKLAELEQATERLQGRESELSVTINELSTILTQNRDVLVGNNTIITELAVGDDTLSDLDPATQSIECWTCGSHVERQAISNQLDDIEQLVEAKRQERANVRDQLSKYKSERSTIQDSIRRQQELSARKSELEHELDRKTELIERLTDEATTLREKIADLQIELESRENKADSDEIAAIERLSELEYERGQLEQEIQDINDDINEIEYLRGKSNDLEARKADITEQITSLRSRVESLEEETVNTFNTHMEAVLDRLNYENLSRIWIERRKLEGETVFSLHVVREDDSGTTYEGLVQHLSESEREVVGLVVALAGYLAHDVQQTVPVLLLDSLEAIDAKRIADLVNYFETQTNFLLVALLHEDTSKLSSPYDQVVAEESLT